MSTPPIALSIAGSDPSGGAGIQADLKTFSALGVYGCAALAGLTAQNTQGVRDARPVDADFVVAQIEAILDDLPVAATKLGMLSTAEVAGAVADVLERRRGDVGVVVLDPVMVATSGDALVSDDTIDVIRTRLMPLADLITPNLPEAAVLLDADAATGPDVLARQSRGLVAIGARAALVKGGHLTTGEMVDVWASRDGERTFADARIDTRHTHGTGCTLSSAIAACAARRGEDHHAGISPETIAEARAFLRAALASGAGWRLSRTPDTGHGPVNHLITGKETR